MTLPTILTPLETRVWSRWYTYAPLRVVLDWKKEHGNFPVVGPETKKNLVLQYALYNSSRVGNPRRKWEWTRP